MAQMDAAGFDLLKKWEKCVLYAYDDANDRRVAPGDPIHGTLTIGYGHTGRDVTPGLVWDQAQADQTLQDDVADVAGKIAPLITAELSDNQFSAFVCLAFNIGEAGFKGSTALRLANANDFAGVPAAMELWNKTTVDGVLVVSQGLIDRRAAEVGLWNS